ncbi:MAG: SCO family protein [Rhodospirillales bacterium]
MKIRTALILAALGVLAAALAAAALILTSPAGPKGGSGTGSGAGSGMGAPGAETLARAAIGGPFTLTDHTGREVTDADFKGRFMLIFFGYTYCPDVCPTTLSDMADAVNLLGADQDKVTPVFITVDPARDTVAHLKDYVAYFHPRMAGLTGTLEQTAAAARAYKIFFRLNDAPAADPQGYLVDHSSIMYLMGPDGAYAAHFPHGSTPKDIAQGIREHL